MNTLISAQHVKKSYGKAVGVQDASLELYQGEILALLGPNGAGKTTFIKILATILSKDEGKVEILGYDLDKHEREIQHLFGYVGQDTERSAYARLTVIENLEFFGSLRGLSKQQIHRQVEKLAAYFDISDNLKRQFMHLSGGQKQTVIIIRALLHDPPVIYLDEPTKGLDPFIAKKLRTFLKKYVFEGGKSLLLTTHILSEVEDMANRVALINQGTIAITSTSEELKAAVGAEKFVELPKDHIPESTRAKILTLGTVLFCVERTPNWISFGVSDILESTEEIIHVLREDKIQTTFRHSTVSLEDAFVRYVGANQTHVNCELDFEKGKGSL